MEIGCLLSVSQKQLKVVEQMWQQTHFARLLQYSDVVTDLTSEKALLLINRKLAQAEEHNRQLSSQLKAKSEQLKDQAKLNDELQQLLAVKVSPITTLKHLQDVVSCICLCRMSGSKGPFRPARRWKNLSMKPSAYATRRSKRWDSVMGP